MKLGVMSPVLGGMSLRQMIEYLSSLGVQSLELGCGGYPGKAHCDAADFLAHPEKIEELKQMLAENHMDLPALACHGNPLHPDKAIAGRFESDFDNAVLLAEKLGVKTLVAFSGCPGDCPESKYPNWVTCPWPDDFLKILDWQWSEKLIPYWKKTAAFAEAHGVTHVAFEMHPGFCVYNPETMLKLRAEVGPVLGANFDPSHLIWQGIDPVAAVRYLKGAIYHVHAKDTKVDPYNTAVNGVLDTKRYSDEANRSWIFRTVGYGLDYAKWKEIMSALRMVGYDYAISIEHEDGLMSPGEGLDKAIEFLKEVMIYEEKGSMWWV